MPINFNAEVKNPVIVDTNHGTITQNNSGSGELDLNALFQALLADVPEAEKEITEVKAVIEKEQPTEVEAKQAVEKLAPFGSKIGAVFGKLGMATVKGLIKEVPFGNLLLEVAEAVKE